jgi:arylsulfatase
MDYRPRTGGWLALGLPAGVVGAVHASRVPLIFNLRLDPYERADITSKIYYDWLLDHAYMLVPAQKYVGQFLATFKDYPPRQKAASFSIDQVMEKMRQPSGD